MTGKNEKSKIERIFEQSQNALVLQSSDLSLQSVSDMIMSKAIDISPKYQRRNRWTLEKQSSLIESFLLNIPVPPIYLAEDEYGTYSVIDGKQRLTAIHLFLTGEIKLKGLDRFEDLEGYHIEDLPSALQNALKIRPHLRIVTLLRQSNPELKHEVFLRLNKAGVALNSQEIRNVAYRGNFNDLLMELSEEPYFRKQLKITEKSSIYREMGDVQYVLRFFTVHDCWEKFPGNMDVAMDNFMANHYKATPAEIEGFRSKFISALKTCSSIWGDEGFMKPGSTKRILQGFYDIQMVGISLLSEKQRKKILNKKGLVRDILSEELKNNAEFEESTTAFTSNPGRMRYRISRILSILKAI